VAITVRCAQAQDYRPDGGKDWDYPDYRSRGDEGGDYDYSDYGARQVC
jgi:hypothetical protein